MSHEETEKNRYNAPKMLSDDKVSLLKMPDGSHIIEIKTVDKSDREERCLWLERIKKSSINDETRHFNLWPPSTYNITPAEATIRITGDIDELEDAIRTLHSPHNYISEQKMDRLVEEIGNIRLKEIEVREKKVRQEKKQEQHRKKYMRLAEQLGMGSTAIFPNIQAVTKKSTSHIPPAKNDSATPPSSASKISQKK